MQKMRTVGSHLLGQMMNDDEWRDKLIVDRLNEYKAIAEKQKETER